MVEVCDTRRDEESDSDPRSGYWGISHCNFRVFSDDSDGDGLSNLAEIQRGTEFGNPDTDGDGLTDGAEVNIHGTNPLDPDSDKDGLNDKIELEVKIRGQSKYIRGFK